MLAASWLAAAPRHAAAGGSGLNVAIVVNQRSTNSVQLGNYYTELRQVPAENLVRINWTGGLTDWSKADFETTLLQPLTAILASRGLTNQVDTVLLSMDIPYRVVQSGTGGTNGCNSTTSALFYGYQPDGAAPAAGLPVSCSLPDASSNHYAGSELPFRSVAQGNAWLTFMLTASNLASAKAIVDRGVVSDGTFPTQRVFLTKSTDTARNVRYLSFDDALMDTQVLGRANLTRTNLACADGCWMTFGPMLGCLIGQRTFTIPPNSFMPGAMADSLTSYGGLLFSVNDQTTLLSPLTAGATASYGTVIEPCNWLEKFPSPRAYFYQSRGFSIAESYYQGLTNPFQGLLVGEPLAAPFAASASGDWVDLAGGETLSGTANLGLQFTAPDASRPVQQVDLFLDGKFLQTLTNLSPQQDNRLVVTIAGRAMPYIVPTNATLRSVVTGLADTLNQSANTNATRVQALARGDRIELRSFELGRPGEAIPLAASSLRGGGAFRATFVTPARTNFLSTSARGRRSYTVTKAVQADSFLQLTVVKTNGASVTLSVTNAPGNTNTFTLVQSLLSALHANPNLNQADGLAAEDFVPYQASQGAEFNLLARRAGWAEAQLTVTLTGSPNFSISPGGTQMLDENLADLMPRNHLYLSVGVTNLSFTFPLDTTALADGFHELSAVAYEGSHVRTQKRVTRTVRITNSPLAATFTPLVGGGNTLVTATLQFAVAANTNNISRIELFSTGGWFAGVTNASSAIFHVAGTNLHVGLHPFYALVTSNDGKQFRTETHWIRLVAADFAEAFQLSARGSPPTLSWPTLAGRTYEVLSTTNPAAPFQVRASLTATLSSATWTEPSPGETVQFYRVRAVP